jgi:hypothetical protein
MATTDQSSRGMPLLAVVCLTCTHVQFFSMEALADKLKAKAKGGESP